jgi:hypothetical protein
LQAIGPLPSLNNFDSDAPLNESHRSAFQFFAIIRLLAQESEYGLHKNAMKKCSLPLAAAYIQLHVRRQNNDYRQESQDRVLPWKPFFHDSRNRTIFNDHHRGLSLDTYVKNPVSKEFKKASIVKQSGLNQQYYLNGVQS